MHTNIEREPTTDEAMGMAWWNSLSEDGRSAWAKKAGTGVAADAWSAYKESATSFSKEELYEINDALHETVTRMCVQGQTEIEIKEKSLLHLWSATKKVTVMLLGDSDTPGIRNHEPLVTKAIANPKVLMKKAQANNDH